MYLNKIVIHNNIKIPKMITRAHFLEIKHILISIKKRIIKVHKIMIR